MKQVAIAVLGEPARTCQVRLVGTPCAIGFASWVEFKHYARYLFPRRALCCRVKQPKIDRQMRAVIVCHLRFGRGDIGDRRGRWRRHDLLVFP